MAKTYLDAITLAQKRLGLRGDASSGIDSLDQALKVFWLSSPWVESFANLEPFWLRPGVSRYENPWIEVPLDLVFVSKARIVQPRSGSVTVARLRVYNLLQDAENERMAPRSLAYDKESGAFLTEGLSSYSVLSAFVDGRYKFRVTPPTTQTLTTTVFPIERHFYQFVDILRWVMSGSRPQDFSAQRAITTARANDGINVQPAPMAPEGSFAGLGIF